MAEIVNIEWVVIGVISTIIGLFITVAKPIIKLNTSITTLTTKMAQLIEVQQKNEQKHQNYDNELEDHEKRITVLEYKDKEAT